MQFGIEEERNDAEGEQILSPNTQWSYPIPDKIHELTCAAIEDAERRPEGWKLIVPGFPPRTPTFKKVHRRFLAWENGEIDRVYHEDPILGTKGFRLVDARTNRPILRVSEVDGALNECVRRLEEMGQTTTPKSLFETLGDFYCGISYNKVRAFLKNISSVTKRNEVPPEHTKQLKPPIYRPIDDGLYDYYAKALGGVETLGKNHPFYNQTEYFVRTHRDFCRAEWVDIIDQQHIIQSTTDGRWQIVDKVTGRIIPRQSEVESLVMACSQDTEEHKERSGHKRERRIYDILKKHYAGISSTKVPYAQIQEILNQQEKSYSGSTKNVQFPPKPRLETMHPMQHIQIDIMSMHECVYGNKVYDLMLVVQCMFSHFWFARALPTGDRGLITRHLLDIFGTFGPPEAYQCHTDTEKVGDCMADVSTVFGVTAEPLGRAGVTQKGALAQYSFRKRIYKKSCDLFDDVTHWVEALPYAVIEENQKPASLLNFRFTPFEVMFARQPWPDRVLPPWVATEDEKRKINIQKHRGENRAVMDAVCESLDENWDPGMEGTSDDYVDYGLCEEDTYWKRTLCEVQMGEFSNRQEKMRQQAWDVTNWRPGSCQPPTGYLYYPGDEVYVRNPEWEDHWDHRKSNVPRFFKGLITDRNLKRSHPYRVKWTETQWTAGEAENTEVFTVEDWVSVYDVVGTTRELETKRRLKTPISSDTGEKGVIAEKPDRVCQCPNANCREQASNVCTNRMHRNCCLELRGGCNSHVFSVPKRKDLLDTKVEEFDKASEPVDEFSIEYDDMQPSTSGLMQEITVSRSSNWAESKQDSANGETGPFPDWLNPEAVKEAQKTLESKGGGAKSGDHIAGKVGQPSTSSVVVPLGLSPASTKVKVQLPDGTVQEMLPVRVKKKDAEKFVGLGSGALILSKSQEKALLQERTEDSEFVFGKTQPKSTTEWGTTVKRSFQTTTRGRGGSAVGRRRARGSGHGSNRGRKRGRLESSDIETTSNSETDEDGAAEPEVESDPDYVPSCDIKRPRRRKKTDRFSPLPQK